MKIIFLRVVIFCLFYHFHYNFIEIYPVWITATPIALSYPILLLHGAILNFPNINMCSREMFCLVWLVRYYFWKRVYRLKIKISWLLHIFKVHGKECFLVHFKATVDHPKHDIWQSRKLWNSSCPVHRTPWLWTNIFFLTQITTMQTGKHFFK